MFQGIDLYSDTVTRPSTAMRQVMADAEVGDAQMGEDPTTAKLESMAASLLGKSGAIFLPSATMANQIALQALCRPGDEIIASSSCHVVNAEAGGPAVHSHVLVRTLSSPDGTFTAEDVEKAFRRQRGPHYPISRLVCVENTANIAGGIAWPKEKLDSVIGAAKRLGLSLHLDGARLMNAAVKLGVPPKELASPFDTITLCLSKGLGCPVGALLLFDKERFAEFRRFQQLMGGAMRQSGILAAAGVYALENNIVRLRDDHDNAQLLAKNLGKLPFIQVENPNPSTNMVYFSWKGGVSGSAFASQCLSHGLRFSEVAENRFRAVTHLGIQPKDIDKAIEIIHKIGTSV